MLTVLRTPATLEVMGPNGKCYVTGWSGQPKTLTKSKRVSMCGETKPSERKVKGIIRIPSGSPHLPT